MGGKRTGAIAVGLVALWGHDALGASSSARLTYVRGRGAESCPNEEAFRDAVKARLGYDPFFPVARDAIVVTLDKKSGGFVGRVQQVDDRGNLRGEKSVSSKSGDCGELVKTAALAVSLAIDDLAIASAEAPKPVPPPEEPLPPPPAETTPKKEAAPAPTSPETTVSDEAPARTSPVHITVTLGGTGSLGLGVSPTGGGRVGLDLTWHSLQLGIENTLEAAASSAVAVPGGGNARLRTSLTVASAHVCLAGQIPFVCAAVDVGSFQTEGENITDPKRDAALFVAGTARAGVRVWLSSTFFATGSMDAVFPLLPYRAEINGAEVFSSPLVGGRVELGLGARIF